MLSISGIITVLCPADKPPYQDDVEDDKAPYKMIQTIGLSVGAAVAYIIVVLGLMFYCKKRRNTKRLQKGQDGEEPEMECLNGRKQSLDYTNMPTSFLRPLVIKKTQSLKS